ncbi:MAG: imidazole glycerol phosphate synthase subunit HisH [Nitrospinota bacterium]|nr:imidazole glycerol phosphate synthase subunit HisH [Nitrospinota bacterium]
MSKVTVIDYGSSNLLNVVRALEHCGAEVLLADQPKAIIEADRLILPGVGAFADGMASLKNKELIEPLKSFCQKGNPFLGICLGMQMMLDASDEFGHHQGLGLISGKVVPIPSQGINGEPHKIPHIGWNELQRPRPRENWDGTLFAGLNTGDPMYFVHSFMAVPEDDSRRLADCEYNGRTICAALQYQNMTGCQFHPEKSGKLGLSIIYNFLQLK